MLAPTPLSVVLRAKFVRDQVAWTRRRCHLGQLVMQQGLSLFSSQVSSAKEGRQTVDIRPMLRLGLFYIHVDSGSTSPAQGPAADKLQHTHRARKASSRQKGNEWNVISLARHEPITPDRGGQPSSRVAGVRGPGAQRACIPSFCAPLPCLSKQDTWWGGSGSSKATVFAKVQARS